MNRKRMFWLTLPFALFALAAGISAYAGPPRGINCKIVVCAAPDCLENEHLQVPPGACCPVCVPN